MTTANVLSVEQVLAARVRLPQHIVFRAFPAETVVLNLDTGQYHSVNPAGGHFLDVLERSNTVREALDRLHAEFPKQDRAVIQADLYQFYVDLAQRGIIEVNGSQGP